MEDLKGGLIFFYNKFLIAISKDSKTSYICEYQKWTDKEYHLYSSQNEYCVFKLRVNDIKTWFKSQTKNITNW